MKLLPFTATALSLASAMPSSRLHKGAFCVNGPLRTALFLTWGKWDDDWGNELLENLRALCGQVDDWGFDYSDGRKAPPASHRSASADSFIEAMYKASGPTGHIQGLGCYHVRWVGNGGGLSVECQANRSFVLYIYQISIAMNAKSPFTDGHVAITRVTHDEPSLCQTYALHARKPIAALRKQGLEIGAPYAKESPESRPRTAGQARR